MWTAIDIFIGLALCYALVSLFCTAIQEFIAQMLDSRGKLLVGALRSVDFGSLVNRLGINLLANPGWLPLEPSPASQKTVLVDQAARSAGATSVFAKVWAWFINFIQGRRLMTDPTPENLATTISSGMGLIVNGASALTSDTAINSLSIPDGLKARLLALSNASRNDVDKIKTEVEKWCGDFLAEVNHWFTRQAQIVSLLIGFAVALVLNIDTIELATKLKSDAAVREATVKVAGKLAENGKLNDCPEFSGADSKREPPKDAKEALERVNKCLTSVQSAYPIPLGWKEASVVEALGKTDDSLWGLLSKPFKVACVVISVIDLTKLIGLLLTAIALSLGSRFWFDTLKNLLALRTGGQPKTDAKT
jgi:hypothetical protein